jgi:D-alanyl-D-alanine carboxypeptidase/D-alanyl-D-alanine-endopeptidase (penicillin-binding protein 4)
VVRAKTGTLTGVGALAGVLVDADGRLLAFTLIADAVPATDPGRAALDAAATALAGCGCH